MAVMVVTLLASGDLSVLIDSLLTRLVPPPQAGGGPGRIVGLSVLIDSLLTRLVPPPQAGGPPARIVDLSVGANSMDADVCDGQSRAAARRHRIAGRRAGRGPCG